MKERKIKFTVDSNLEDVALIGTSVNRLCTTMNLSDVEAYNIELCVVEAANNCVKHAYNFQSGSEVEVIFTSGNGEVKIEICDSGKTMQRKSETPTLEFDPEDMESLPESGMGLYIISEVMDKMEYKTYEGKNILTMIKSITPVNS